MKYRKYTAGSEVSEIGMGTWQLGAASDWKAIPEPEAIRMVEVALDNGVNFFDTAPNYGQGASEKRLGKALKAADRSRVVINTKFGHTVTGAINFDPDAIRSSIEGSLRRLQTDYLDSAIFHNPPADLLNGKRADAHYELLERLTEEGKIKAYGASLDTYDEIKQFLDTTNGRVVEAFFNILHQGTAKAFGLAQDKGAAIIVKIPMDSGWLSGKYGPGSTFEGVRSRWTASDINARSALVAEVERLLAPDFELPQVALAFCLAYDVVATVIPGSSTAAQLRQNIRSGEKPLPPKIVTRLEDFYKRRVEPLRLPW